MTLAKQKIKRWVALGVCICFIATLFPEAHAAIPSVEMAVKAETPRILNIDIPTELASVDEWYQAPGRPSPKLIVHIQDAHANYEAQARIRDVIKHLNTNYGFKTILVEGAASELDPNLLKLFPDQERNLKLVDELAKIGEVNGAEMFLVENSAAAKGVGIEKPDLYRKNFDALQKVYSDEGFVSGYFESYEKKLGQIASRSFGPRMIQALAEWRKFESGHRDFLPFISKLAELSKKVLEIDLGVLYSQIEWPQLTRLLVLQRVEKELEQRTTDEEQGGAADNKKSVQPFGSAQGGRSELSVKQQAELEKQRIVELLKVKKLPDGLILALEKFDEKTANLNRIGSSEVQQASAPRVLMEMLVEEGAKIGFDIRDYPAFAKYAGYLILRSEIVPGALFEEIKKLFNLILESLVNEAPSSAMEKSDDLAARKRLLLLHRDEMLARKLLKLELTHDEWLAVLDRQDRFYPEDLNRRMLEQLGHNTRLQSVSEEESAQMKRLNESFRAAFTFYSAAVNRDTYFFQRTQEVLTQTDKAILITGGFHAEGMKYLFRKHNINYGTLTPRITQNFSNEQYRKVMMTGFESYRGSGSAVQKRESTGQVVAVSNLGAEPLLAVTPVDGSGRRVRWENVWSIAASLGLVTQDVDDNVGVTAPSESQSIDGRVAVSLPKVDFESLAETGKAGRLREAIRFLKDKGIDDVLIIGSIPRAYLLEAKNDGTPPIKGEIDLVLRDRKQADEISEKLGIKIDLINGGVLEVDGWQIDIEGWFTDATKSVVETPVGASRNMLDWPSYSMMAFGLFSNGEWFDPHGGAIDAKNRVLRWNNPREIPLTLVGLIRFVGFYHGLVKTGKFNVDERAFKRGENEVRRALDSRGTSRSGSLKIASEFYSFSKKIKELAMRYSNSADLSRVDLSFQILTSALLVHLKNKLSYFVNDLKDRYYVAALHQFSGLLINTGNLIYTFARVLFRGASFEEVLFHAGVLGFNIPIRENQIVNFSNLKLPADVEEGTLGIAREIKYLVTHAESPQDAMDHLIELGGQWLLDVAGLDRDQLLEDYNNRNDPEYAVSLVAKYGLARSESRSVEGFFDFTSRFLIGSEGRQTAIGVGAVAVGVIAFLSSLFFSVSMPAALPVIAFVIAMSGMGYVLYQSFPAIMRVLKSDKKGGVTFVAKETVTDEIIPAVEVATEVEKPSSDKAEIKSIVETPESLRFQIEKMDFDPNQKLDAGAISEFANLVIKFAQLASAEEDIQLALNKVRLLRNRKINNMLTPSQYNNLLMQVATLAVKLNEVKRRAIPRSEEVVVTAKASREAILASLSVKEKDSLKLMTYQNLKNQIKNTESLSPSQAVDILITYGIISQKDRDAARKMAELASLAVAKVASGKLSELAEMIRTFFPEMISKDGLGYVGRIIDGADMENKLETTILQAILNPDTPFEIVVFGESRVQFEIGKYLPNLYVRHADTFVRAVGLMQNRSTLSKFRGSTRVLIVVPAGEDLQRVKFSSAKFQVVQEERGHGKNLEASVAIVRGAQNLARNVEASVEEEGIDKSKGNVWTIDKASLSMLKDVWQKFQAALQVMRSA